ncbi:MAG: hypothetical protein QOF76_2248 [Solirubrobacteraceae bacterium]|nr:hypothetical protein [Solirubrobacteraceae bacterium]
MARDLIPPPSPGGRADPDAERRAFHERELLHQPPTVLDEAPPVAGLEPAEKSRFGARFGLITGAVAGFGIAAIAVLVLVLANRPGTGPAWSRWHPTYKERDLRIVEIARFVGREYRLDDGDQMLSIDGSPLDASDGSAALRVVARTSGQGEGADIAEIDGHTVLYTMKGLGPGGTIDGGTPSVDRAMLARREATELALYTFKYVKNVDNVVTLLPTPQAAPVTDPADPSATPTPNPTATATATSNDPLATLLTPRGGDAPAMLFRAGDLETQLKRPLATTLPEPAPRPSTISPAEVSTFQSFSLKHDFFASIINDQLGSGILVLDRQPAADDIEAALRNLEKG